MKLIYIAGPYTAQPGAKSTSPGKRPVFYQNELWRTEMVTKLDHP